MKIRELLLGKILSVAAVTFDVAMPQTGVLTVSFIMGVWSVIL
jgi:hypothetical protein